MSSSKAEQLQSHQKPEIQEVEEVKETKNSATRKSQSLTLEIKEKFIKAIQSNDLMAVKQIVESGIDINTRLDGKAPLILAAKNKTPEIFEYLLSQHPNLRIVNESNRTLSETVALFSPWKATKKVEILKSLQDNGATPLDPLFIDGILGNLDKIKDSKEILTTQDSRGCFVLHYAAANGKLDIVKWLLAHGADINNAGHKNNVTPFYLAIYNGQLETIEELLKRHPQLLKNFNFWKENVLFHAVAGGQVKALELLISKMPPQEKHKYIHHKSTTLQTPLLFAASKGQLKAIQCLLEHGANIHDTDDLEGTALLLAAEKGHFEIVKRLCENHLGDIRETNKNGRSALTFAAIHGYLGMAKWLSNNHPKNINDKDNTGKTPLHWAAQGNHLEILQYLHTKAFAEQPNKPSGLAAKNNNGETPLHCAAQTGAQRAVEWIVTEYPYGIHQVDNAGKTPLHSAVTGRHLDTVRYLIARGSNLHHKDINGNNILMSVILDGRGREEELVPIFMSEFGIDPNGKNGAGSFSMVYSRLYREQKSDSTYLNNRYQQYFVKQRNHSIHALIEHSLSEKTVKLKDTELETIPHPLRQIIAEYAAEETDADRGDVVKEIKTLAGKLLAPLKEHAKASPLGDLLLEQISYSLPDNIFALHHAVRTFLLKQREVIKGSALEKILDDMIKQTGELCEARTIPLPGTLAGIMGMFAHNVGIADTVQATSQTTMTAGSTPQ